METYVVSACIDNRSENSPDFQAALSRFSCRIQGRLGIPHPECSKGIVILVMNGDDDVMAEMKSDLEAVPGTSINYMTI